MLNGYVVENDKERFPFIVYKNITYMPMTWEFSRSLGLRLKWSEEAGLSIASSDVAEVYIPKNLGAYTRSKFALSGIYI